jgi:WD40 repeat protein
VLEGHQGDVKCVAFSPDGTQLLYASADRRLALWLVATGAELQSLLGHSNIVLSCAFHPSDSRVAASCGADKSVRLWDLPSAACTAVLQGHSDWVRCVAFSPDGASLLSFGPFSALYFAFYEHLKAARWLGARSGVNGCPPWPIP